MTAEDGLAGLEEAVFVFAPDGLAVTTEMRFSDFEALAARSYAIESLAGSRTKAAYVRVGSPLAVRGIVFFVFGVDEQGLVDASFNVPLRYIYDHAGAGPDLGLGAIRLACRGQCPVPWHAVNLWDPHGDGEAHPAALVQRAVWRNRLGLKPTGAVERLLEDGLVLEEPVTAAWPTSNGETSAPADFERARGDADAAVEAVVRQHREQLDRVARKFREDLERQQQTYLDQIRGCKDEIQQLKAALRHEQQRSRRLQALLRGDP